MTAIIALNIFTLCDCMTLFAYGTGERVEAVHAVGACATIKLTYAVLVTQLVKVCYYSITHYSAPSSQGCHVSPALDRLPALPLQVSLTGFDQDGPPSAASS